MQTINSVFILFFLILTTISTNGGQSNNAPPPTDLKQVIEDLRVLARVTNAIYFHFAAIQKEVSFDLILAEFFRVPIDQFYQIVKVDVLIFSEVLRMTQEYMKFKAAHQEDLIKLVEIEMGMTVLDTFSELIRSKEILEEASNFTEDSLLQAAKDVQKSEIFQKNCSKLDAKNLDAFRYLFSSNPKNYDAPDNGKILEILKKFQKDIPNLRGCLKEGLFLERTISSLKIQDLGENYEATRKSIKLAMEFSVLQNISSEMSESLDKIKETLENSTEVWFGDSTRKPEETEKLKIEFEIFHNSTIAFLKYKEERDQVDLPHTAGFRNASEIMKVFDDLKHPWFQKNIVRGASTVNLEKVFEPYRNITYNMGALNSVWRRTLGNNGLGPTGVFATETYKNITNFAFRSSDHLKLMNSFKDKFTTCLKLANNSFNPNVFLEFERQQRPAENVMYQVKKVAKVLKSIKMHLEDNISPRIVHQFDELIDIVQNEINNTMTSKEQSATKVLNRIKMTFKLVFGRTGNSFDAIKHAADLVEEMTMLKELSEKIDDTKGKVTMKDIVKHLKMVEIGQCFRPFETEFSLIKEPFYLVKNLILFPLNTPEIISYLKDITVISTALDRIPEKISELASKQTKSYLHLIPPMNNSRALTENLGESIRVLEQLENARHQQKVLLNVPQFSKDEMEVISNEGLSEWISPGRTLILILRDLILLDEVAKRVRNESLIGMTDVFDEATKIRGLSGRSKQLIEVYKELERKFGPDNNATLYFKEARNHDLDFTKHHARLTNARVTANSLNLYFDELFGHTKKETVTIEKRVPVSYLALIFICVGFIVLVLIFIVTLYGITDKGRRYYKDLYIYYFGKPEDFERRWRYSLFLDTVDGKNAVLDAVREVNRMNLLKALKHGAYIDAYNKFGNTALHLAIKNGLPDLVLLLIKYGADRNLLNYKNLLPIQMIPADWETKSPEKIEDYNKIIKTYRKYEDHAFRVSVPKKFPTSSFHIYPDESTDVDLTIRFSNIFTAIVSEEAIPQTTHAIFKTDENGILETDSIDILAWIFQGTIIIKEQWMADCLVHESLIEKDAKYLVENVKYKGVVYNTVLAWSEAMAKATMPYLQGVFVTVVAQDCKNLVVLSNIVNNQGGVFLDIFPFKQLFNIGSRPYLHAHLGPLFLIHSGTEDLEIYRNDPDHMYTLFTEEEFMVFMLKREINKDTRTNPPSTLIREE